MMGKFPSPWVFFDEFVSQSRPLLMKKALIHEDIPAFHKWTDHYMSDIFGHIPMEVETGKKEDRKKGSIWHMSMEKYISVYKKLNGYLITDIPDSMKVDIKVPLSLQCGGFQDNLHHVIMWFSSGGTNSHLHNDGFDNINCILDGSKEIILIDKKYGELVKADGWDEEGSFSHVNVDEVDMYRYPQIQKVPYHKLTVTKGDCLYIPITWFHQVYSLPGRNMALNFWFHHLMWYNSSQCDDMDPYNAPAKPLVQFDFPNKAEEARSYLLESFEGKDDVTMSDFLTLFADDAENRDQINECFAIVDEDKNGILDWSELYKFDLEKMVLDYPNLFRESKDIVLSKEPEDELDDEINDEPVPGIEDFIDDGKDDDVDDNVEEEESKMKTESPNTEDSEEINDGVVYLEHTKREKPTQEHVVDVDSKPHQMKHQEL